MWFTEDPWPPVMILAVFAVVFAIAWNATRRSLYFLLAAGFVVLSLVVIVAEEVIVTESEGVENLVYALVESVKQKDMPKILDFFEADAEDLRSQVESRLDPIDVQDDLRITDMEITLEPETALSHFRANGSVSWHKVTHSGPTRWRLTWQKAADTWKINQVEQLDPVQGRVIRTWGR